MEPKNPSRKGDQEQKILLDSGGNEVEMMEFKIGSLSFGVNVAKVQSVFVHDSKSLTKVPDVHESIMGVILLRGETIPLVNLAKTLGIKREGNLIRQVVVLLSFNKIRVAILVDGINRIHRISWNLFIPLHEFCTKPGNLVLGSFNKYGNEIMVIDFEKIMADIFPHANVLMLGEEDDYYSEEMAMMTKSGDENGSSEGEKGTGDGVQTQSLPVKMDSKGLVAAMLQENAQQDIAHHEAEGTIRPTPSPRVIPAAPSLIDGMVSELTAEKIFLRENVKIVHIDDSSSIRLIVQKVLSRCGYKSVSTFENGYDAYNYLRTIHNRVISNEIGVYDAVSIIISDIEMPQMDGLTLCKRIRDEFVWDLPIIMFSSLIDEQMVYKCQSVGATTQLGKADIRNLDKTIDELVKINGNGNRSSGGPKEDLEEEEQASTG
ncbi:MAG: chemotaxis protein CheW [Oligoflexia bacterium]|nr:chemotaxis protein CheW [Oligoflexia bacterium]